MYYYRYLVTLILQASRRFATLQLLPSTVITELQTQLDLVGGDDRENQTRRAKAALQYAVITFGMLRSIDTASKEMIEVALGMLCMAASYGNQMAQCIVGSLHETFDKPSPFNTDVEVPWLVNGTVHGSMTARKRLMSLCLQEYDRAMYRLRHEYAGVGLDAEFKENELKAFDLVVRGETAVNTCVLHRLANVGKVEPFRRILGLGCIDVNEIDAWGETALLVACRSGHSRIARMLLDGGADASIASKEGLTPLHFLGALEDNDIPEIAIRLLENKAKLEARSTDGKIHYFMLDSQFGKVEGTPLLWAISSGSLTAASVLVELGADPFDIEGEKVPVTTSWGNHVHLSPIDYAARMHQHDFLEVLLNHSQLQSATTCSSKLNNGFRLVAPQPNFAVLPLFWAVDYMSESLLGRLLLHGNNHQSACRRTIQILVDHGSDPSELDNRTRSALEVASLQGHPFLTAYILQFHTDLSKLTPSQFLELLFNTVRVRDYTSFNLLVEHSPGIDMDDDLVDHFFARTTEITDDVSFIDFYLNGQRRDSRTNSNDNEVFERAILQGNFTIAQRIFEDGHVNLRRRMVNEWGNESTIFGRLLARSKKYYNAVDKIRFFLSLTQGGDEVFFNVGRVHDMEMSALHVVSIHADYRPDLVSSLPPMNAILEKYYEDSHLNACVSGGRYAGCTALHLAIDGGNIDSAGRLLNEGAETDIVNDQGETAFDLVKIRWRNQARYMTDLPHDRWRAAREDHDRITERLTDLLERHDAKARKYWGMVRKINPILIQLEVFGHSASDDVLLNSASK